MFNSLLIGLHFNTLITPGLSRIGLLPAREHIDAVLYLLPSSLVHRQAQILSQYLPGFLELALPCQAYRFPGLDLD